MHKVLLPPPSVTLIGPPGVGKSDVGEAVSKACKMDFVDIDVALSLRFGFGRNGLESVEQLFRKEFVDIEQSEGILAVLSLQRPTVFATGGSMVECPLAMKYFGMHTTIISLDAPDSHILKRLEKKPLRGIHRLHDKETNAELLIRRRPLYAPHAHLTIDCVDREKAVRLIVEHIHAARVAA